jgi:hypothetical protein
MPTTSALEQRWDLGQSALAAGRYVAAQQHLEAAERLAWRQRDLASLARLTLPLLEARRQIRHNAVDGTLVIDDPARPGAEARLSAEFLEQPAGTILLVGRRQRRLAAGVQYAQRRTGRCLEALLLVPGPHRRRRLASLADPVFAAGLPTHTTTLPDDVIQPADPADLTVPLPPAGTYAPRDRLHAVAREALLLAWEALALKWQARHPAGPGAWSELAWLRGALRVDPACEPVMMRFIALAESLLRAGAGARRAAESAPNQPLPGTSSLVARIARRP